MKKWGFLLLGALLAWLLPGSAALADSPHVTIKSGLPGVADIAVYPRENTAASAEECENGQFYDIVRYDEAYGKYFLATVYKLPDCPSSFPRSDLLIWKYWYSDGQVHFGNPGDVIPASDHSAYISITLEAVWDGLEGSSFTLAGPASITLAPNEVKNIFQISLSELSLDLADVLFIDIYQGTLTSGENIIPFKVNTPIEEEAYHYVSDFYDNTSLTAAFCICIDSETWANAKAGVYQGSLYYVGRFKNPILTLRRVSGTIPITLTLGHSITVTDNGPGTTTLSQTMALEGETVYVTLAPDDGCICRDADHNLNAFSASPYEMGIAFTMPNKDVHFTVNYAYTGNAVFKNQDGTILWEKTYAEGEMPEYGGPAPAKSSDDPHIVYLFSGWSPALHTVERGDNVYVAQFQAKPCYQITFAANGGSGSMEPVAVLTDSGSYRLPACGFDPPEGMMFRCWEIEDSTGLCTYGLSPNYTYQPLNSDLTITAHWQESPVRTAVWPANGGRADYDADEGTFTATPNPGYSFLGWKYVDVYGMEGLDYASTSLEYKPGTIKDGTYLAYFSAIEYTVQVSASNGVVSASPSVCTVGTGVTLTATPNDGYRFVRWDSNVEIAIDENGRFSMPAADVVAEAVFEEITYHVAVVADPVWGGSVTGSGDYCPGAAVTLTATPLNGYRFREWVIVSGEIELTNGQFTMPERDVEIRAVLERIYSVYTDDYTGAYVLNWLTAEPVSQALKGTELLLSIREDVLTPEDQNLYCTEEFLLNNVTLGTVTVEGHTRFADSFIMPGRDVTVTAVTAERTPVTVMVTGDLPSSIHEDALGGLLMTLENDENAEVTDDGNLRLDLNADGVMDIEIAIETGAVARISTLTGTYDYAVRHPRVKYGPFTFMLSAAPTFGVADFILPASVAAIEANAFEHIAASVVIVPANCASIGDCAFKDCENLQRIRIPSNVVTIGEDIFTGCPHTVYVYGTAGSAAEAYCQAHNGCVFVVE